MGAAALTAMQALVYWAWLTADWIDARHSIEGAFIGLARIFAEEPDLGAWFPWWYGGVPTENVYPPLLIEATALLIGWFGLSPALAYHLLTGACLAKGPAAVAALAFRLSGDAARALWSGVVFAFLSPSIWMLPQVFGDATTVFDPRRYQVLAFYGAGPQVMALTLIPAALLLLDRAMERPRAARVFLAALAFSAVPLTNWIGAFALAWATVAYVLVQKRRAVRAGLGVTGAVGVWAYALACPWLTPTLIADIARNGQISGSSYPMDAWRVAGLIGLAIAVAAWAWALRARVEDAAQRLGLTFLLPMAALPWVAHLTEVHLVPQAWRYQLELELAVALALGPLAARWVRGRRGMALVAAVAAALAVHHARFAVEFARPLDVSASYEKQAAAALAAHEGRRVYTHGSLRFWLSAFETVPQFGGGFGPGVRNPVWWTVDYGIPYTQGDGERTARWLEAYGVDLVLSGGPETRDWFPIWRDGRKFAGELEELWREGDDALYQVERRNRSLAHVIPEAAIVPRAPENVTDVEPIEAYLAALDAGAATDFERLGTDRATVRADFEPGQALSVQMTYDPRWEARCDGRRLETRADGLGQMVVLPEAPGPCAIELAYRPTAVYRWVAIVALLAGVGALVLYREAEAAGPTGSETD